MASTYSNLKIELIATGEQSGQWGATTNTNLGTAIEQAIGGRAVVPIATTTVTLTLIDSNVAQDARALYLQLTGVPGGPATLNLPAVEKSYIIYNATNEDVTAKVTGETGVLVPEGKTMLLYNNGTDIVNAITNLPAGTTVGGQPIGGDAPVYTAGNGLDLTGEVFSLSTPATLTTSTVNETTPTGHAHQVNFPVRSVNGQTGDVVVSVEGGGVTAVNANSPLASSGGAAPTISLNQAVPLTLGGTGATTSAAARSNLQVPSTAGVGASGTWNININGYSAAVTNGLYTVGSQSITGVKSFSGGSSGGRLRVGTTSDPSTQWNAYFRGTGANPAIAADSGPTRAAIPLITIVNSSSTGMVNFNVGSSSSFSLVGSISRSGSTTQYNTTSDYRLKENIVELESGLDRLATLRPVRFSWTGYPDSPAVDGFIAHEVAEVVPEAVTGEKDAVDDDGKIVPQQMDASKLVPILVASVQELKERVETLERELKIARLTK